MQVNEKNTALQRKEYNLFLSDIKIKLLEETQVSSFKSGNLGLLQPVSVRNSDREKEWGGEK